MSNQIEIEYIIKDHLQNNEEVRKKNENIQDIAKALQLPFIVENKKK